MAYKSPLGNYDLPNFRKKQKATEVPSPRPKDVNPGFSKIEPTITKTGFDIAQAIADRSKTRKSSGGTGRLSRLSQAMDATDNVAKKARLQGQYDRTSARQENRAVRIEAKNKKKLEKTIKRQAKKNDSALNFGLAASFAGARAAGAGFDKLKNSAIGRLALGVASPQEEQANMIGGGIGNAVMSVGNSAAPVAPAAPITPDGSDVFKGKTFQITPANMKGEAKPLFPQATSDSAAMMYDSPVERQMSMPSSGVNNNPIEANAFIKAKIDAEKAGDSSFTVDGKQYQVK
jgi:hypothetical protein